MNNDNLYSQFAQSWNFAEPFLSTPGGTRLSYADLDDATSRVAQLLLDTGAVPGDRVSVQAAKSVEYILLYLGCVRAGFVFHPLNPAYTKSELDYFLSDAAPAVVVFDPASSAQTDAVAKELSVAQVFTLCADGSGSFRDSLDEVDSGAPVLPRGPNDLAALLYSSGTTGQPKGIPLTHHNIAQNARELADAWGFTSSDVLLHALPMFHTHGLFIALNCTLMTGSQVRYLSRFDADAVIDELPAASVMMGVPTYYTRLLASDRLEPSVCESIRLFTSGSAPLREDTFHEFTQRTKHVIVERYGMTETVVLSTNPLAGVRKAGTVGLPLPSVELRIADANNFALAAGEVGRIQVRGPNVFHEYWRKPEKTAEDFTSDGYFDTGDQGRIDEDGYVAIVGRAKDLVISGGLNVYPIEVELVLNEFPGIEESAVIGVPHADFGEAVVAVAIVASTSPFEEDAARAYMREHLASFKVPKRVIAVDDLPRNAMGKVQKNRLRDDYANVLGDS